MAGWGGEHYQYRQEYSLYPLAHNFTVVVKLAVMKFTDYFKPLPPTEKRKLARRLGVSLGYCYRLAGGFSSPSRDLSKKVEQASKGAVPMQDWS